MLKILFDKAIEKAGNQEKLGEMLGLPQSRISAFRNYNGKGKKPSDSLIGELAIYVGWNPLETVLACKTDTDKEKATLWETWLNNFMVRSAGLEPTPQASETCILSTKIIPILCIIIKYLSTKIIPDLGINNVDNFINQLTIKQRILSHNLNEHSALY